MEELTRLRYFFAWLFFLGVGVLLVLNPGSFLPQILRIVLLILLGLLFGMALAALPRRLRHLLAPQYHERLASWKAQTTRFNAMVDHLTQLFDQGHTDEEIAIKVVSETGCDYEQALADVQQLRLDYDDRATN